MPAPFELVGRTLGRYEILEQLGAGGMGAVYRARDTRLDRQVALKALLPEMIGDDAARLRLRKEALTLSRLSHPRIAAIFDFDSQDGVDFLVMELIPGTTLDHRLATGGLPEAEILRLGVQLAEGLAAAHEQGIIHRDLKPSNLMVTPDGSLKILDFGIARLVRPPSVGVATRTMLDEPAFRGTLAYAAPDQLQGKEADARTDVYAAGAVLYEMATGGRPFAEAQAAMQIDAILHQAPRPPRDLNTRLSSGLESVILKALERQPERRYPSARELAEALERLRAAPSALAAPDGSARSIRWLLASLGGLAVVLAVAFMTSRRAGWQGRGSGAGEVAPAQSLAVLPLANLSGDPDQEYFADGMTDALITDLGKLGSLRVVSRASTLSYRNLSKPIRTIGSELRVDAVVSGAVLLSGDRVRITAQLIDARTDLQLWAETYERDLRDVISLQDDVALAITEAIRGRMTPRPSGPPAAQRRVDPEAYRLLLKGFYYWNKRTQDGFEKAVGYLQQAIDKDPTDPASFAALASVYLAISGYGLAPTREELPKARAAALRALELDDTSAEAHEALAEIDKIDWKFAEAEREYRRALDLDSNFAGAHQSYGTFLATQGRLDEALSEMKKAVQIDPLWFIHTVYLGDIYRFLERPDEAIELYKGVLEMDPAFWQARGSLVFAYEQKRMYPEAYAEIQKVIGEFPHPHALLALGELYALWGKPAEARKVIRDAREKAGKEPVSAYWLATVYAALNDKEKAFRLLEDAYQDRDQWILFLKVDPRLASLRTDPRFHDLIRRIGLERGNI